MNRALLLFLGALLVLIGCSRPSFETYDDAAYAGAICTDGGWTRVPDNYCPIGDDPVDGQQFFWRYRPYRSTDRDIDVVYVGYPVDQHIWVNQRPARVSTLHIDRGSFPIAPPAGVSNASTAKVDTAPARARAQEDAAKGIKRQGLGDTGSARDRPAVAVADVKPVAKKNIAPPPAGERAIARAKKGKK